MKFSIKTLAVAFGCLSSGINAAMFGPEDGVIEMNDKNFYDHINEKKFMLTMFYAPWCHHCTKAAPEYIAAAEGLSTDHPPVHLGVINGDHPETEGIRKHLKVDSYPTFIWWDYGVRMPYNVDHDRKTIMKFVREQTGVIPTSGQYSRGLQSNEIFEIARGNLMHDQFAAFCFSHPTSKMFNFYQELQKRIAKKDKSLNNLHNISKFKFYHAEPSAINFFYKDHPEIEFSGGSVVILSPGNDKQLVEDHTGIGLGVQALSKFLDRMSSPAFDRMTHKNIGLYFNQSKQNIENKQVTFLASRDPQSTKAFEVFKAAAIEQKWVMKYTWVGGPAPPKETYDIMDAAAQRQIDLKAKFETEKKRLEDSKDREGPMTAEKKQQYGDIDEAKKKLEKDHKFLMTDEEHEASDKIKTENVFKTFMKNFHLEEKDLPVMMFYDPLTKQSGPMYYPVEIKMEDITKEVIIKEANKFVGQWLKPINKSEPRPDNEGKAHKKIVGANYQSITSDPEGEALVNHSVDWEVFCKILQPEFEKLAEELKEVKGLTIGTFNAEKNKVGFVNPTTYPQLVHYSKTNKRGTIVKFNNKKGKQVESLKAWLAENSDAYKAHLNAIKDDL